MDSCVVWQDVLKTKTLQQTKIDTNFPWLILSANNVLLPLVEDEKLFHIIKKRWLFNSTTEKWKIQDLLFYWLICWNLIGSFGSSISSKHSSVLSWIIDQQDMHNFLVVIWRRFWIRIWRCPFKSSHYKSKWHFLIDN